jgi:hypothetical protein
VSSPGFGSRFLEYKEWCIETRAREAAMLKLGGLNEGVCARGARATYEPEVGLGSVRGEALVGFGLVKHRRGRHERATSEGVGVLVARLERAHLGWRERGEKRETAINGTPCNREGRLHTMQK